jgi:hypothetical protein
MQKLDDKTLFNALMYAKSLDETAGRDLLLRLKQDQPALLEVFLGIFPAVILQQNELMANHYMDLCFDVLCVFKHCYGPLCPQSSMDPEWLQNQASLLMNEINLLEKSPSSEATRLEKAFSSLPQAGLLDFMDQSIRLFIQEHPDSVQAAPICQSLIISVIRLLNNLYDHTTEQRSLH